MVSSERGYSREQVKNAKHRVGAIARKHGLHEGVRWTWQLRPASSSEFASFEGEDSPSTGGFRMRVHFFARQDPLQTAKGYNFSLVPLPLFIPLSLCGPRPVDAKLNERAMFGSPVRLCLEQFLERLGRGGEHHPPPR